MAPKRKKQARSNSATEEDPALKRPTPKRAKEIDANTPYDQLDELLEKNNSDHKPRNVLHWFRSKDLRQEDNKALHQASQKAKEGSGSLITMYLHSPKDLEWHGTSPARIDFLLESLRILQKQLEDKHIPLTVVEVPERNQKTEKVLQFVKDNNVSHIYANMEYEVDELRRDITVAKAVQAAQDLSFEVLHDQTAMEPTLLTTNAGGPIQVFTPYHKAWLSETKANPSHYDTVPAPEANDKSTASSLKKLFGSAIPDLPETKNFASKDEQNRLRKLWPPGHEAGMQRLDHFLNKKVSQYAAHRIEPAKDNSSRLSPYFSAGIISVREVLQATQKWNKGAHFDDGDVGVDSWVREIVFREFYRHMMIIKPHGSMNMPQNLKFDFVQWEEDEEGWEKWCEGKTGVPFVDAGMRQLNHEAYMHNRLRMNTASYLRGNLLIDYRRGERYFAEHLVDWDMSNNTNGWEPNYTMFNPITQAEKCDKNGDYIRKWVPELKDVPGKAIFAPYDRLSKEEFQKLGYPEPHVNFDETAQRAKERYKRDLHSADI
ncbi:DNA photolyase, FAD-binding/Cryptochrome [Neohortaea acidophila]|uniref:DNA photolyase, FAD-binding/Cryptochrome n=1 Tax=Neohortaea acidophila TaxID=245834 RepID=A0A6A6Q183_9PEZI|nr:DNA photolyase, FAD-binding/Cryptochrome [Neohortaea acidophila]KAF2486015.1 DNA photolyase, FAD-binding/Cryptochrome [Neohortaea acidophila]